MPTDSPGIGVTVRGASLRATTIKPSTATQQSNVFLLQNNSTVEDLTIAGVYYDTVNDTGYAFAYVSNATISTRSPYVQRVTVLNKGSVVSSDDPYGYDTQIPHQLVTLLVVVLKLMVVY